MVPSLKTSWINSRFLREDFWRLGILIWGQILNVKVQLTTLLKKLPFHLVNHIGVKK